MTVALVYLHGERSTFEEGDELEEVISYGVSVGLEAFLLAGLFLHDPDETPNTLHDR